MVCSALNCAVAPAASGCCQATVRAAMDVPAQSYYIPLNQPLANLAVAALEPDTQNSYFANRLVDDLNHTARVMATPALVFEEID